MKLFTFVIASLAVAAGQVYNQPIENYGNPEIYQSGVEFQQHNAFDQPQGFAPHHNERRLADKAARILAYQSENNVHNYQYAYETENGIKGQEVGQALGAGTAAQGGFQYTGDDGQVYAVSYTADELGFRPQGAHLPTPPPIPDAILKSLEQNAKDEAAGIFDDGKYRGEHHAGAHSPTPVLQQYEPAFQPEAFPSPQPEAHTPQVTITQSAESGYQHL